MKKFIKFSVLAALCASFLNAASYEIDKSHSDLGFMVRHLKISKVRGNFQQYNALIDYDKASNELKALEVSIDANSINTQNQKRDEHLKNNDFFDTPKFDKITFKMTKFEKEGSNEGKIYGDLTIKGVKKPIKLDFEYHGDSKNMSGAEVIGFSINGDLKREDFGIGEKFPDAIVSNKVELKIEVEAKAK
ncbi:YceI family protein [Campylobacter sp. RM16191]|uniref:YceI family protein n=1 Tax=Campylobacter sp. RM16191 TaxID=1705728 RepID=UPI001475792C|nr:YceI family protein [Campylobacter sp. RM16191]